MISQESQEIAHQAQWIYEHRLKAALEPAHAGAFVAIEPTSGEYIGEWLGGYCGTSLQQPGGQRRIAARWPRQQSVVGPPPLKGQGIRAKAPLGSSAFNDSRRCPSWCPRGHTACPPSPSHSSPTGHLGSRLWQDMVLLLGSLGYARTHRMSQGGLSGRIRSRTAVDVGPPSPRLCRVADVQPVARLREHKAVWTR